VTTLTERPAPASATEILERMKDVVRNDMLIRGDYVTEILDEELAAEGSICGGRKACAIGSLWLAADAVRYHGEAIITSFSPELRWIELRRNEMLREAYDALNRSAHEFADDCGVDLEDNNPIPASQNGEMEALFEMEGDEGSDGDRLLTDRQILDIIENAKAHLPRED